MNIFYVYMKVWYMCECGVHVLCMHHMEVLCSLTWGRSSGSWSTTFCLIPSKQGLSLKLKLGWWLTSLAILLSLRPTAPGLSICTAMPSYAQLCPAFHTGAEDSDLGPHVCIASTLSHWDVLQHGKIHGHPSLCSARNQTQGFLYARQALCQLNYASSPTVKMFGS